MTDVDLDLELVFLDFPKAHAEDEKRAFHCVMALLLDGRLVARRVEFLKQLGADAGDTKWKEVQAGIAQGFDEEIELLRENGAVAIERGGLEPERLGAILNHPVALVRAHEALVAGDEFGREVQPSRAASGKESPSFEYRIAQALGDHHEPPPQSARRWNVTVLRSTARIDEERTTDSDETALVRIHWAPEGKLDVGLSGFLMPLSDEQRVEVAWEAADGTTLGQAELPPGEKGIATVSSSARRPVPGDRMWVRKLDPTGKLLLEIDIAPPSWTSSMSAEQKIRELLDPETGLHCLPPFWKAFCLEAALGRSPEDQARYLDEHLMILAQFVEPLASERLPDDGPAPFAALCEELAVARSFLDVCQKLGLAEPDSAESFAWWAFHEDLRGEPLVCVYTASSQLAWPLFYSEYPPGLVEAPLQLCLATDLCEAGMPGVSAKLLESYLGLDEADYRDGETMRAALAGSERLAGMEANIRAVFLGVQAAALGEVEGRGVAHAARLLESYLGLDEGNYRDGESMRAALADSEELRAMTVDTRTKFLRSLADALRFVKGRGGAHAARLLESSLELDEGD